MENINATPRKGQMIVITDRKVSVKVQPHVKRGNVYIVIESTRLKDGAACVVCHVRSDKKKVVRINEERFAWRIVTQEDIDRAETRVRNAYRQQIEIGMKTWWENEVRASTDRLMEVFSYDEHMKIVAVPLIISEIAWSFAIKARKQCAKEKIEALRDVSRAIDMIRREYLDLLEKDMKTHHIYSLNNQTRQFMEHPDLVINFTRAHFTISNEYLRQFPNVKAGDCRIFATIAVILIDAYKRHIRKVNKMLEDKVGLDKSVENKIITVKLLACMDAIRYIRCDDGQDRALEYTADIKNFEKILDNCIGCMQFDETQMAKW